MKCAYSSKNDHGYVFIVLLSIGIFSPALVSNQDLQQKRYKAMVLVRSNEHFCFLLIYAVLVSTLKQK